MPDNNEIKEFDIAIAALFERLDKKEIFEKVKKRAKKMEKAFLKGSQSWQNWKEKKG